MNNAGNKKNTQSTFSNWRPTIHDVISARTSRGNAYWIGWDGRSRFAKSAADDNLTRMKQSFIHTYEALGMAKRHTYRVTEPACHIVHHTGAASFVREVINKKRLPLESKSV